MHAFWLRHAGFAGDTARFDWHTACRIARHACRADAAERDAGAVRGRSGAVDGTARFSAGSRDVVGLGHDERRRPLARDKRRAALHHQAAGTTGACEQHEHPRNRAGRTAGLLGRNGARTFDGEHAEHGSDPRAEHGAQHGAARLDAERNR